jgi:predicted ATPase/class 3 adenylate cyclase
MDQPAGVVTLLFTDIEGSTRLLHDLGPEAYRRALADHRDVLRAAFERHRGYEVHYEGDAFVVAFDDAHAAVEAAAEAQAVLESGPVRVRIGLHTGTPILDPPKYVGLDVHLAARVMSAAHGGQTLLTAATRAALVPWNNLVLGGLGEHRLKDFDEPVLLFQLGDEPFPPLRTVANTNLPRPVSSFVGRERELPEVLELVRESRLVTLTGPGGTGKTRLAIETAAKLVPELSAGAFWVPLAAVRDPALVLQTVAQTLGAKLPLAEHVGERELLLVLDNFEQVVDGAAELSQLLRACPNLRALVTSRELLRIQGEIEYPVPPLSDPEAVELFSVRSRKEPDEAVRELCRRLDNLPLAVELAAGRTRVLSARQILERLSRRLDLLEGGRDAEARQLTLRATIEWSHELLTAGEQQLFARLAVFASGCTLAAAEQVADADLDRLQSLIDKSLLERRDERFSMLETIREYALEQLEASGEADELRRRELRWLVDFAETIEPGVRGPEAPALLDRMEQEYDNVRDALESSIRLQEAELGGRVAVALWRFWLLRRPPREALTLLRPIVSALPTGSPLRAKCLLMISNSLVGLGRPDEAQEPSDEALEIARASQDTYLLSWALNDVAIGSLERGDVDRALATAEENLAVLRTVGDETRLATALAMLGNVCVARGELPRAAELFEEASEAARRQGNREHLTFTLSNVGLISLRISQPERAVPALVESLRVALELGYTEAAAYSLLGLAAAEPEPRRATVLLGASSRLAEDVGIAFQSAERELYDQTLARLRVTAGFDSAWEEGAGMSLDAAVGFAVRDS